MDLSQKMSSNLHEIVNMISTRMTDIEERLNKATSSPVPVHADLPSISREFTEFKTLVWRSLALFKGQLELLSLGHERHETYLRRNILLIHGVTENSKEKLHEVVKSVFISKMGLSEFSGAGIQSCFRLGHNLNKPRPILVRFVDTESRLLVWYNKTTLKGSGYTISEFLTKSRHTIFIEARKHFGIHSCWSSEGKIVVMLPDKTRRKLEVYSELQLLISQFPQQVDKALNATSNSAKDSTKSVSNKDAVVIKSPKKSKRRQ